MNVQLDSDQQEQLEALARQQGRPVTVILAELVRRALREAQNGRSQESERSTEADAQTCLELATASGFLGADADLPSDLSTNPIHMDGFGRD